ncbi:unnamed protein product [Pedinophyceae sp. YPF-701]|nr:unnamed protein product [Pedinophyceae sp. YPF-701]
MLRRLGANDRPADVVVDVGSIAGPESMWSITVGRARDCDLSIDSPALPQMISRNHAEFRVDLPSIRVVDKGSTNGTWINEQRITPNEEVLLRHGDMLSFGGPACVTRQDRDYTNPFRFFFDGIPSHVIARSGTVEHMRRMLATTPQDLYTTGVENYTCLHVAVTQNKEDTVAFLAQHCRPLLSARTSTGLSALHLAADAGRPSICKLLIDSGVDLMEPNNVGFTAAHIACIRSHLPVLRFLVDERNFPVNFILGEDRRGLLHYSAFYGSLLVLRFLLERGADPRLVTARGRGPLHFAAIRGHVDTAQCLIEVGGVDVNQRDNGGVTPLHMAAEHGAESVVRLLVQLGADVNARTNNEITPTRIATTFGHTAIVNFFRNEVGVNEPMYPGPDAAVGSHRAMSLSGYPQTHGAGGGAQATEGARGGATQAAANAARTGTGGLFGVDAPALQTAFRTSNVMVPAPMPPMMPSNVMTPLVNVRTALPAAAGARGATPVRDATPGAAQAGRRDVMLPAGVVRMPGATAVGAAGERERDGAGANEAAAEADAAVSEAPPAGGQRPPSDARASAGGTPLIVGRPTAVPAPASAAAVAVSSAHEVAPAAPADAAPQPASSASRGLTANIVEGASQRGMQSESRSSRKKRRVDDDDGEMCSPDTIERMVADVERGLAAGSHKDAEDVLRGASKGILKQVLRHATDAEKYGVAEVVVTILRTMPATSAQGGASGAAGAPSAKRRQGLERCSLTSDATPDRPASDPAGPADKRRLAMRSPPIKGTVTTGGAAAARAAAPAPVAPAAHNNTTQQVNPGAALDLVSQRMTCAICFEVMVAPHIVTPCGHTFCGACICQWMVQPASASMTCPKCRAALSGPPAPSIDLEFFTQDILLPTLAAEQRRDWHARKADWDVKKDRLLEAVAENVRRMGRTVQGVDDNLRGLIEQAVQMAQQHIQTRRMMSAQRGAGGGLVARGSTMVSIPTGTNAPMPMVVSVNRSASSLAPGLRAAPAGQPFPPAGMGGAGGGAGAAVGGAVTAPAIVEYVRLSRMVCTECGQGIEQGDLRVGTVAAERRSSVNWTHFRCVSPHAWSALRSVNDLVGLSALRPEDRQMVEERVSQGRGGAPDLVRADANGTAGNDGNNGNNANAS